MSSKTRKTAVITGATGGLGREISACFIRAGVSVYLLGRNIDSLKSFIESEGLAKNGNIHFCKVDFNDDGQISETIKSINEEEQVDFLIHGAAFYSYGKFERTDLSDLDRSYKINVRAPYLLTNKLLPKLISADGVIAFINSSVVNSSGKKNLTNYASTKSALKSMADCIRQEVNSQGVRVITYFLGKVATSMQKKACKYEGIPYKPEKMIQPTDVAKLIYDTATMPNSIEITDLHIRPPVPYE